MTPGIFAKTFPGNDPADVLASVRTAGFTCVQYNWSCAGLASMPDVISDETLQYTLDALQVHAIKAVALSGTFNMIHPDPAVVQRGLAQLAVIIDSARALDIPIVTLCTGSRHPEDQWTAHPGNDLPAAWDDLLRTLEPALEMAQRAGVVLGVEPELANTINTVDKAYTLMQHFDTTHLRIVLDPANLFETVPEDTRRSIISSAISRLAPYISLCHAKDRTADGDFCVAGKGVIDYPHYLACLQNIGYKGAMITHGLSADEAPDVARFLSKHLAQHAACTVSDTRTG